MISLKKCLLILSIVALRIFLAQFFIMFDFIYRVFDRLQFNLSSPADNTAPYANLSSMELPQLSSIPHYSDDELTALAELISFFNNSKQISSNYNLRTGRLEFVTEEGVSFWFACYNDSCKDLVALLSFNGARYRAALLSDGRVSLTGWCENWVYGVIASNLTLAK